MTGAWHEHWHRRLPRSASRAGVSKTVVVVPRPVAKPPKAPEPEAIAKEMRVAHRFLAGEIQEDDPTNGDLPLKARTLLIMACGAVGMTVDEVRGPGRYGRCVRVRQAASWLIRKYSKPFTSLPQIGRMLGGRDHSTILHAVRRVEANRERYEDIIAPVEEALRLEGRIS